MQEFSLFYRIARLFALVIVSAFSATLAPLLAYFFISASLTIAVFFEVTEMSFDNLVLSYPVYIIATFFIMFVIFFIKELKELRPYQDQREKKEQK